ncbi:nitrous oxide-stimulated promoter family protein [Pontiellaceae bacterium B12219]|nr:nitrous oxide-stimulated promoter family protein [Pontiellaceae bacterium B12219]
MNSEYKTIELMVGLYCRKFHGTKYTNCSECEALLAYAGQRIEKCPFGTEKPVCNSCPVHCYKPDMRAEVKAVMRYAGPRMLWRHPILAVRHFIRARRYSGKRSK